MPELSRLTQGTAFDDDQLIELRAAFDAVCSEVGLTMSENDTERRTRAARLVLDATQQGLRGDALRYWVVTILGKNPNMP
jgi:hypothetical protein